MGGCVLWGVFGGPGGCERVQVIKLIPSSSSVLQTALVSGVGQVEWDGAPHPNTFADTLPASISLGFLPCF